MRIRASGAAFSLSAIRHASTVPTTPAPRPASAPQAPVTEPASAAAASPAPTTPYNIDTVTLDDIEVAAANDAAANIPEGIGYLSQIGLDYGWGPTSMIEWTLEHFHIWGGLPWWGAIAATAITMRAITFPLYLKSADQAARQAALVTITKPITERMTDAQKSGDQTAVMQAWTELNATRKRAGLSYTAQFTPMFVQAVLGFCSFKLMRAMASLPVPGLKDGGFGWMTDLTISDGYLVLPALMAGSMHMMFRYGGETGQTSEMMNPAMRSFMLWGMPGLVFLMTGWQSGAVCIWFVASGAWAMSQAMLMQKPAIRKFFGIAPMYRPTKSEGREKGIYEMAMARMEGQSGGSKRTIDTTATSKPATAGPAKMSYQAPNVRTTRARGPEIPKSSTLQASASASEAPAKEGVFGQVKSKFSEVYKKGQNMQRELAAKKQREAVARAAETYEKRARDKRDLAARRGGR